MNEKIRKIIGKILPTPKGDWSTSKMYDKLDFVLYNGAGYISIKPTDDKRPINEDYWKHVYMKGDWSDKKSYRQSEVVIHEGIGYYKKINDATPDPEHDNDYWTRVNLKGDYINNRTYYVYDVVSYQGDYYLCLKSNYGIDITNTDIWVRTTVSLWIPSRIYDTYDIVKYECDIIRNGKVEHVLNYYYKTTNVQNLNDNTYWEQVNIRGDWSEDNLYNKYDIASFTINESTPLEYMCIKSTSSHSPINNTDWIKVCERGEKGDRGETGSSIPVFTGVYDNTCTYHILDVVYHKGSSYICICENTTGHNPHDSYFNDEKKWQLICRGFDYSISDEGTIQFNDDKIKGIKSNTDFINGQIRNEKGDMVEEYNLTEKIEKLQKDLNYCLSMLKKYQLD